MFSFSEIHSLSSLWVCPFDAINSINRCPTLGYFPMCVYKHKILHIHTWHQESKQPFMDHAKSYFMRESNMLLVARQPSRQSCSQLKRKFKEKTKPLKILIIFQETTTNHFQNINNSSSKKNYPHHDLVHSTQALCRSQKSWLGIFYSE